MSFRTDVMKSVDSGSSTQTSNVMYQNKKYAALNSDVVDARPSKAGFATTITFGNSGAYLNHSKLATSGVSRNPSSLEDVLRVESFKSQGQILSQPFASQSYSSKQKVTLESITKAYDSPDEAGGYLSRRRYKMNGEDRLITNAFKIRPKTSGSLSRELSSNKADFEAVRKSFPSVRTDSKAGLDLPEIAGMTLTSMTRVEHMQNRLSEINSPRNEAVTPSNPSAVIETFDDERIVAVPGDADFTSNNEIFKVVYKSQIPVKELNLSMKGSASDDKQEDRIDAESSSKNVQPNFSQSPEQNQGIGVEITDLSSSTYLIEEKSVSLVSPSLIDAASADATNVSLVGFQKLSSELRAERELTARLKLQLSNVSTQLQKSVSEVEIQEVKYENLRTQLARTRESLETASRDLTVTKKRLTDTESQSPNAAAFLRMESDMQKLELLLKTSQQATQTALEKANEHAYAKSRAQERIDFLVSRIKILEAEKNDEHVRAEEAKGLLSQLEVENTKLKRVLDELRTGGEEATLAAQNRLLLRELEQKKEECSNLSSKCARFEMEVAELKELHSECGPIHKEVTELQKKLVDVLNKSRQTDALRAEQFKLMLEKKKKRILELRKESIEKGVALEVLSSQAAAAQKQIKTLENKLVRMAAQREEAQPHATDYEEQLVIAIRK